MVPVGLIGILLWGVARFSDARSRYRLTPLTVFVGSWFLIVLFYGLDPVLFHMFSLSVTFQSVALHLASLVLVCLGGIVIALFSRPARTTRSAELDLGHLQALTGWVLVALGLVVVAKIAIVMRHYGNPVSALCQIRSDTMRGTFGFSLLGHANVPLTNVSLLNLGALMASRPGLPVLSMSVGALAIVFLNDLTLADQEGLRLVVLFGCAFYYAATIWRGQTWRSVGLPGAAVVVVVGSMLMVGIGVLRAVPVQALVGHQAFTMVHGCGVLIPTVATPRPIATAVSPQAAAASPQAVAVPAPHAPRSDRAPKPSHENVAQRLWGATATHLLGDVVGNYVSSSWFLERPLPNPEPGANTLSGFYGLLSLLHRTTHFTPSPDMRYYAPIMRVGVYNTTDYVAVFYSDFGVLGVVVLSLLLGGGAMLQFTRAFASRRLADTQTLALVIVGLVMSIRGNYFGSIGFWLTLVLLYLQAKILTHPPDSVAK